MTPQQQFLEEVVFPYESDACLPWPFHCNKQNGYAYTYYNGQTIRVARFICKEVHGEPPNPTYHAAHSCNWKKCVNKRHVSWKTPQENIDDKTVSGTVAKGERHGMAKLTTEAVAEIRSLKGKESQRSIARRFGVHQSNISLIQNNKKWRQQ